MSPFELDQLVLLFGTNDVWEEAAGSCWISAGIIGVSVGARTRYREFPICADIAIPEQGFSPARRLDLRKVLMLGPDIGVIGCCPCNVPNNPAWLTSCCQLQLRFHNSVVTRLSKGLKTVVIGLMLCIRLESMEGDTTCGIRKTILILAKLRIHKECSNIIQKGEMDTLYSAILINQVLIPKKATSIKLKENKPSLDQRLPNNKRLGRTKCADPPTFSGEHGKLDNFLAACHMNFKSKGANIWNLTKWLESYDKFIQHLRTQFGDSNMAGTAMQKLPELRQTDTAAEYFANFELWSTHLGKVPDAMKIASAIQ
ncbi:hypothetical protein TREMEDRAFT_58018 [Tremella mesenterica DSM 1558]|uniref:uncharacterized protein n=1 Tax=Tremella mesenterica (strain ATCC 24925 / CBS 8224 / DSM 1558 / NBRC 9311 / NRRL Y-6157 / RJB 2259-6 / UBC 559-6) TaxID=578456 RepID=UPI0003F49A18|nr:uncharacterized protein TREMEDRAFT_58018 [Tremella mesenterica DSM 1558]EIW71891.1 hypothetical protein TREMEDRAFT_58018 [Tremella mesenterica DSM 1558]